MNEILVIQIKAMRRSFRVCYLTLYKGDLTVECVVEVVTEQDFVVMFLSQSILNFSQIIEEL